MPSPMSALLCPRPGLSTATRCPPLAVYGEAPEQRREDASATADPLREPRPSRRSAVPSPGTAQASSRSCPRPRKSSDPAQPTGPVVLPCPALPAASAQRQPCLPAAGYPSPGLALTCWPCWAPSNRPCLPAQSRHSWLSSQCKP